MAASLAWRRHLHGVRLLLLHADSRVAGLELVFRNTGRGDRSGSFDRGDYETRKRIVLTQLAAQQGAPAETDKPRC